MLNLYAVKKNEVSEVSFSHKLGKANSQIIWNLFFTDAEIVERGLEGASICFKVETLKTSDDYKILVSMEVQKNDSESLTLVEFSYFGIVTFLKNVEFYYLFGKEFNNFEVINGSNKDNCVRNTKTPLMDAVSFHINKHLPLDSLLTFIEYSNKNEC